MLHQLFVKAYSGIMSMSDMFNRFFSDSADFAWKRVRVSPCVNMEECVQKASEMLFDGAKEPVKKNIYKEVLFGPATMNALVVIQFVIICVMLRHSFVKFFTR